MIRVRRSLICDRPAQDTFPFIADFANLPDWDPGIASSRRLDEGPIRTGARYEVVARFLGRRVPMVYEVTRYEPPHRIVLEGRSGHLRAIDDIRFEPVSGGTRIRYRADFRFSGAMRWAEKLIRPAFERLASRAMQGMQEALRRRAA